MLDSPRTMLRGWRLTSDVSGRFGSFEEFKKHNVGPDGTLSAHKKFLCGLGVYTHQLLDWLLDGVCKSSFTPTRYGAARYGAARCRMRCLTVPRGTASGAERTLRVCNGL